MDFGRSFSDVMQCGKGFAYDSVWGGAVCGMWLGEIEIFTFVQDPALNVV